MKYMGLNEIRESFLKFFESKGHYRMESSSLVPQNDKSLLLINSGMAPLKPFFTGVKTPPSKRVTTCQKCIRTGDIENVGKTSRHGTFFEMLGNFSFGDYFKEDAIKWAWEYSTEVLGLPKDRLFATVYEDDDEAIELWKNVTDIDPNRIFKLGKEDNFWEVGLGPCGPCSELHYDRVGLNIKSREEFEKASDEDKIVEYWNLVFTQFEKTEDGEYIKLKNPNIDTGLGLERISTILQNTNSIFEVDTIKSILDEVCKIANVTYGENQRNDISIRVISDHIRSVVFMLSDGIIPSNEGRGYVLRRLLRRAARHGKILGINEKFLTKLSNVVIENSKGAYNELESKRELIQKIITIEEENFAKTIDMGLEILKSFIEDLLKNNKKILKGTLAFKLYDTYGFPLELTKEILEEKNLLIDDEDFNKAMIAQRERARNAREETNYMGVENSVVNSIKEDIDTEFLGYTHLETKGKVECIISDEKFVNELKANESGIIVSDKTPFYAEMGGQVGDKGKIYNDNFEGTVLNTKKNISGKIIHMIKVNAGTLKIGDMINFEVNSELRRAIQRNHTATHLLHSALKKVLGEHVNQSGSYVDSERLRFDFTHFESLKKEEIIEIEYLVNSKIMEAIDLKTEVMSLSEAKKKNATALFDDKYSENVRVVSVGDFSSELCGGTHVRNSGEIGVFKIISEVSVASGVRRIEALTGHNALAYLNGKNEIINMIASVLKTGHNNIIEKFNSLNEDLKIKDREIRELKNELLSSVKEEILNKYFVVNGVKCIVAQMGNMDMSELRDTCENLKDSLKSSVVILFSESNGKVQIIAMASKDVVESGVHCGNIVKELAKFLGGGGGGRKDMAQAGGVNIEKVEEAIEIGKNMLNTILK